jgi:hypothetical protein
MDWIVLGGVLTAGAAGWLYWRTLQMLDEARSAMLCLSETVWALQEALRQQTAAQDMGTLDAMLDEMVAELGPDGLLALLTQLAAARADDEDDDYDVLLRAAEDRHDPCND